MQPRFPHLVDRLQSMLIDLMVIVLLMYAFSFLLDQFRYVPEWIRISIFFALWLFYEPLLVSIGCTPGQYIKKLRVRREEDINKHINILQSLIRYIIKVLLGWVSFLTINNNQQKRAIHDFASDSVMIKV